MPRHLSLAELGVVDDPGTSWHPRRDKTDVRDADGNLRDLDDPTVHAHIAKPESAEQVDGARRRQRENRPELAAEDSLESPAQEV